MKRGEEQVAGAASSQLLSALHVNELAKPNRMKTRPKIPVVLGQQPRHVYPLAEGHSDLSLPHVCWGLTCTQHCTSAAGRENTQKDRFISICPPVQTPPCPLCPGCEAGCELLILLPRLWSVAITGMDHP